MSDNLSTLKKLAVCLGCCECTEDNKATTNAEALDFICENFKGNGSVKNITINLGKNGKIVGGSWTDSAGEHQITIE